MRDSNKMVNQVNQKDYYNWRYAEHIHPFPRIHYEIRYQLVKKKLRKLINNLNKRWCRDKIKVLDVGCGTGEYGIFYEDELCCEYVGIDVSEVGVNYANTIYNLDANVLDIICDRNQIKAFGKFDIIFLSEVFEHLDEFETERVFTNLIEILNEGGVIVVTTPNSKFRKFIKECHAHQKEYDKKEIINFGEKLNLKTDVTFFGGFLTSFLDWFQQIIFPMVVKSDKAFRRELKPYNVIWILFLPILLGICQLESFLFNLFGNGYHLFCVFKRV